MSRYRNKIPYSRRPFVNDEPVPERDYGFGKPDPFKPNKLKTKGRRAFPHSEVITGPCHIVNGGASFSTTQTSIERVFQCPASLTYGNFRKPNPWQFTKRGIVHAHGSFKALWPAQYVPGYGAYEGGAFTANETLGPFFNWEGFTYPVDNKHERILESNWGKPEYNQALARLYDEIRQTDLNALLSSYELREFSKLRSQMSSSLKTLVRTLRKAPYGPASLLAAGGWLTYAYVVRPALSDIKALTDFTALLTDDKIVKSSAKGKWDYKIVDMGAQQRRVRRTGVVKVKFNLAYRVRDAVEFDAWRLGFRSPASLMYESIPFSFCLDWIYNMGQYYASLEAAYGHGLIFDWGWMTTTGASSNTSEWSADHAFESVAGLQGTVHPLVSGSSYARRMDRVVLASFPRPRTPSLDLDLASSQLLSAAALLRTLGFGGR